MGLLALAATFLGLGTGLVPAATAAADGLGAFFCLATRLAGLLVLPLLAAFLEGITFCTIEQESLLPAHDVCDVESCIMCVR